MRFVQVVNRERGETLGGNVGLADWWWPRLRGLLGRQGLLPGEGLLLTPCHAVHMIGMRFAIDVAFLDADGRVVAAYQALPPGGRTRWHREARHALELPSGTLAGTGTLPNHVLTWTPAEARAPGAHLAGVGASR
jgi:uncharacterized protein